MPAAISAWARSAICSGERSASSAGGGGEGCLRLRLDFEFAVDDAGGCPKPIEVGGALRRPVSTLVRALSARMLMLFIISSMRDCVRA